MSIFILVVNLAFAPGMTTTAHRTGVKAKSEVVFFTDQGKAILAARKEGALGCLKSTRTGMRTTTAGILSQSGRWTLRKPLLVALS
jgi:hypothetical protein